MWLAAWPPDVIQSSLKASSLAICHLDQATLAQNRAVAVQLNIVALTFLGPTARPATSTSVPNLYLAG